MENMTKQEIKEQKNKEFLEKLENRNIDNVIFKPENLGALEFDLLMTGRDFETIKRPFRIERVSSDTYFKFSSKKLDEDKIIDEMLKTFVAFPTEARDKEFFNLDMEAMTNLIETITDFQQTPCLFIENFKRDKKD